MNNKQESLLFDFLLTLSKGKRHNIQSFFFHPGERIVDLVIPKFDTLNSEQKSFLLYWLTYYSRKDERVFEIAERSLTSKSTEVLHFACRLFSFLQDERIIPNLEKLLKDKKEKIRIDAKFAIKSIINKNHLDFIQPYQWYPTILDNFIFDNYKTEEKYGEAIDLYIIKQLKNEELKLLKQIVGENLYQR